LDFTGEYRLFDPKFKEENMIQTSGRNSESGFTLIELMIVIAIIGILAAIAIPNFVSYRQRAYNSSTLADLKNAMTTQEAYFVDHATYTTSMALLTAAGYSASKDVTVTITSASQTAYTMTATHASGNQTWSVTGPGGTIR
jgi:type IV pilus assembly protein PilA